MKTTEHTPGPWFVNGKAEIHTRDAWQKPIAITFNKSIKAGSVEVSEAIANARLIAAAPKLLEQLEKACIALQCMGLAHQVSEIPELPGIRAAIAEATGQDRQVAA